MRFEGPLLGQYLVSERGQFAQPWRNLIKAHLYDIELATTPCRYGGLRYWFICPLVKNGYPCHRRITKLYLPSGGTYYGCRHCYDLTYESCQEHDTRVDRLCRNPEALLQMLNGKNLSASLLACKAAFKLKGYL